MSMNRMFVFYDFLPRHNKVRIVVGVYGMKKYYLQEQFKGTKEVIRILKSKNRHHNGQQKTDITMANRKQTSQWPNEKGQRDEQRSTKYYT